MQDDTSPSAGLDPIERASADELRALQLERLHPRRHRGVGRDDGPLDPAAGGRPGRILHNAYGYGLFTGGLGAHYGAEQLGCTVVPVSGGMTERQVTLIRDFRPDIIMVTPSYMLAIVDEMERQGDDPAASSLRFGIFGAEPWTNEMRTEMETRRGDQGRAAHLGGPLLPRGDRPAHRRGAARRRRGRARLHLADQAGHAVIRYRPATSPGCCRGPRAPCGGCRRSPAAPTT